MRKIDGILESKLSSLGKIKIAGAAVQVHAGTVFDPPDRLGLAHMCEHAVFLGTKQYPEENSFMQLITVKFDLCP